MLFIHCEGPLVSTCDEGSLRVAYHAGPNGEHTPYWVAACGCGFRGEPRYFRGYAMNELREHHALRGAAAPAGAGASQMRKVAGSR